MIPCQIPIFTTLMINSRKCIKNRRNCLTKLSIVCFTLLTALECNMESMSNRLSCILPPPTPSVAGVHRLVSWLSQGPVPLWQRHRRPEVCLCLLWPPLFGQRTVTSLSDRDGDRASCWGHKWWKRSPTVTSGLALAPCLAACFLGLVVRHPGLPLCWRLRQYLALGCQADIAGESLLEVMESKSFVYQAQGVPGSGLPGCGGFVCFFQPACLPWWESCGGPSWRPGGGRSWGRLLTCGWYPGWWG